MEGLGRYRLVRRIGAGGMAEIWKAKASGPAGFEKVLAIKRILPQHTSDHDFVDMFIEEAKLAAQLVHPNIVQVFDFGLSEDRDYFIAMEYVAGPNLSALQKRLRRAGTAIPVDVALYIAAEVCKGLGHAHVARDSLGQPLTIIHRDVSPHNLLVSYGGEVKITDFGIAKVADAVTRTSEGQVRGKLSYMSPEQAKLKKLDHRSDLFSLGVVLYDLLTGEHLFQGDSSPEIFASVMNYKGLNTSYLPATVPADVASILETALEPDPEQRFESATKMEMAISSVLGPNGAVHARSELSELVKEHFEDELNLETAARAERDLGVMTKASDVSELAGNRPATMKESVARPPTKATVATGTPPRRRGTWALIAVLLFLVLSLSGLLVRQVLVQSSTTATPATPVAGPSEVEATPPPTAVAVVPTRKPTTRHRTPRPTPRQTATATPKPTPTPAAARDGTLVIKARPWANVWIDGKKSAAASPVGRYPLSGGKHVVRFSNPALDADFQKTVRIDGGELSIVVDMKTQSMRRDD